MPKKENKLYEWFKQRLRNLAVTSELLKIKAKKIMDGCKKTEKKVQKQITDYLTTL